MEIESDRYCYIAYIYYLWFEYNAIEKNKIESMIKRVG